MVKVLKKIAGLSMAVIITASALIGCAGNAGSTETGGKNVNASAKGRYLEEEVKLPEGTNKIINMAKQKDESLRIIASAPQNKYSVWDSKDSGKTWTKAFDFPEEAAMLEEFNPVTAIAPTGEIACVNTDWGDGTNEAVTHNWMISSDGKAQEIKIELPISDSYQGMITEGSGGITTVDESESGELQSESEVQSENPGQINEMSAESKGQNVQMGASTTVENGDEDSQYIENMETDEENSNMTMAGNFNGIMRFKFTDDSKLLLQDYQGMVYTVDAKTGELGHKFGGDPKNYTSGFSTAGDTLFLLTANEIQLFDLATGEQKEKDNALSEQVMKGQSNISMAVIQEPFLVTGGKDENTIFFCQSDGMYSHSMGGNLVEQVINGALTSLANPSFGMIAIAALEDDSFLIAGSESLESSKLYRYTYSKDAPSTPSTEIKAYSLKDNAEIRQAIAFYQKQNPDTCVTLEVGIKGDDAMTVSDALRTLNTNIMAGKGPDILILDGMPLDSYIEKGLLSDMSQYLKSAGTDTELLENIKNVYTKDDKLMALPTRFMIPMIQGDKRDLDAITDLKSFADHLEKLKKENPDGSSILNTIEKDDLSNLMYLISSPEWVEEDGTLNQDDLEEFFTQLKRIYEIDDRDPNSMSAMSVTIASGQVMPTYYGISNGMFPFASDSIKVNMGLMGSGFDYAYMNGGTNARKDGAAKVLNGQAENVFVPSTMVGLSSKSSNPEAAGKFIAYLFSKEAQEISQGSGFPINEAAFDAGLMAIVENEPISFPKDSGEMVELKIEKPSEEQLNMIKTWVKGLSVSSLGDDVIKEAVSEQANDCLSGTITAEQAAKNIIQKVNLYLSE